MPRRRNEVTILHPLVVERPGAEFDAGFIEPAGEHKIDRDTIDDDLHCGDLCRAIGSDLRRQARPRHAVFDGPDDAVPEAGDACGAGTGP